MTAALRDLLRPTYLWLWTDRIYRRLPLRQAFQRIYKEGVWGKNGERFCSGWGSEGAIADAYCELVAGIIRARNIRSIVDLGCGDFRVGRMLVERTSAKYTGIDIVPELIDFVSSVHAGPNLSFACADITIDSLPPADLCLVRQVLQHLSNAEISQVLANIQQYPFALISEEVPIHARTANLDKPHGPNSRVYKKSGIFVEKPPFAVKISQSWNIPMNAVAVLRTTLIERTRG